MFIRKISGTKSCRCQRHIAIWTGAIFATDRWAIADANAFSVRGRQLICERQSHGNCRRTTAVRASGTNDKAGSMMKLLRWVSTRTIKDFVPRPSTGIRSWARSSCCGRNDESKEWPNLPCPLLERHCYSDIDEVQTLQGIRRPAPIYNGYCGGMTVGGQNARARFRYRYSPPSGRLNVQSGIITRSAQSNVDCGAVVIEITARLAMCLAALKTYGVDITVAA